MVLGWPLCELLRLHEWICQKLVEVYHIAKGEKMVPTDNTNSILVTCPCAKCHRQSMANEGTGQSSVGANMCGEVESKSKTIVVVHS